MDYVLNWLSVNIPDYAWQIIAFLLPSNKFFQFILAKLGLQLKGQ